MQEEATTQEEETTQEERWQTTRHTTRAILRSHTPLSARRSSSLENVQRDPVLGSSVVAFVVGGKFDPSSSTSGGFKVLGAHTDSPNLRVKVGGWFRAS